MSERQISTRHSDSGCQRATTICLVASFDNRDAGRHQVLLNTIWGSPIRNRVFAHCQTLVLLELSRGDPCFDQSTATLFGIASPRYLILSFKSVLVLVFSIGENFALVP